MTRIKTVLTILLALMLCIPVVQAEGVVYPYKLGDVIEDFTVTTYDGRTLTLYDLLREKDAVLINLWASWCGPCQMEFPYMEEAYQLYKDRIEIVALSGEANDTDDVLASYAAANGLTFPIAQDTPQLNYKFYATSVPTNIMIDRFGVICLIMPGAQTSVDNFTRLFDAFVGEDYTESLLLEGLPPKKPDFPAADEMMIGEVLNTQGGTLCFTNPTIRYEWPMLPTEEDGRACMTSTTAGQDGTTSIVTTVVQAKAGDVLAFDYKTSTEPVFDTLQMWVNDQRVKVFGGEQGWKSFAWAFETDGEYVVDLAYVKDAVYSAGADQVWIDEVRLLSGDEAKAALAMNTAYPSAEETAIIPKNAGAQEIVINDPQGVFEANFPGARYYIVHDDQAELNITLAKGFDPERATYTSSEQTYCSLASMLTEDGFAAQVVLNKAETTGYGYTVLCLYPELSGYAPALTILFTDKTQADEFMKYSPGASYEVVTAERVVMPDLLPNEATYAVTVLDQHGTPVPGVMVQICDDTLCQVLVTDTNGCASVTLEPYAYELHILKLPSGYVGDTTTVTTAPAAGCDLTWTVIRE